MGLHIKWHVNERVPYGSHMGALWVHSPHGANTCPTWAKVREYAHLGHM